MHTEMKTYLIQVDKIILIMPIIGYIHGLYKKSLSALNAIKIRTY